METEIFKKVSEITNGCRMNVVKAICEYLKEKGGRIVIESFPYTSIDGDAICTVEFNRLDLKNDGAILSYTVGEGFEMEEETFISEDISLFDMNFLFELSMRLP